MTVSVTIRNVPQATRDALAERAALAGQSLQEYLSAQLEVLASRPSLDAALAAARHRAASMPKIDRRDVLDAIDDGRR